jgi:hypothetical protein
MTQGWTVEVTTKASGGGEKKDLYYAHIPDRSAAEQAVAKRVAATPDVRVEAKSQLSHDELMARGADEGNVSQ